MTLGVVPLALCAIVVPLDAPWRIAHDVLALLMRYLEWIAALPSAAWASHAPRGWTVAAAVAGVLWLLAPRGVPGRLLGGAWMLPALPGTGYASRVTTPPPDDVLARSTWKQGCPVAPGEPFPTGDLHPPAFPGCRCLLAVEVVTVAAVS